MTAISFSNLDTGRVLKITFALAVMACLTYLGMAAGAGHILTFLQSNGIPVVPGLAEALSTVSTVYGAQGVFLSFLGVTVAPWLAAAVVGIGAVGL